MSNRRDFLKTLAAGGLLVAVGPAVAAEAPAAQPPGWVRIAPDGRVTIFSNTSEIGQGTGTAIAQMLADEMDLDWQTVRIEMAPMEKQFVNAGWREYATYGSGGVARQFTQLRKAGAQARAMLVAAGAAEWKVPAEECDTQLGAVLHKPTGRKLPYAQLVVQAATQPVPADPPLMPKERWRHMGKDVQRLDLPAKTDGSAVYGIDVKVPGMLYAAIRQCPHFGGKLVAVDSRPALAKRGVKKVVRLTDAVAVVADSYWRAQQALDALQPEWDLAAASKHSSAPYREMLHAAVQNGGDPVVPYKSRNEDITAVHNAGMAKAVDWLERTYTVPLLAHATMEPMNGTASVKDGRAELWLPTQAQETARTVVAKALGIEREAVTIHTTLSGGGFGRRIEADFAVQAALIANEAGVPVKLLWSREEDMRHGYHRPAAVLRLRAGFDAGGALTAMSMDSACDTVLKYSHLGDFKDRPRSFDFSAAGVHPTRCYGLPAFIQRTHTIDAGVPLGYWRSVAASQNDFAVESFVDELALKAKQDPIDYRRSLMKPGSRERALLDRLEASSGWRAKPLPGRHRGVAFAWANGTCIGHVVELSVDTQSRVKLHRVTTAIDCGIVVNPRNVRGQVEGGIVFALTAAFYGEITVKHGAVEQSNFTDYRLLSLAETPSIDVAIVDSNEAPGGVGEEAVGPLAPALANALFAATGKRFTDLPLIKAGLQMQ
jgi:isoquinoline 1-oxidoreductase beta subunit